MTRPEKRLLGSLKSGRPGIEAGGRSGTQTRDHRICETDALTTRPCLLPPLTVAFLVISVYFSLTSSPSFQSPRPSKTNGLFPSYVDCETVGFFLKIRKEIGKAWRKSLPREANEPKGSPTWGPPPPCKQALKHSKLNGLKPAMS